ncbi:hypothetical protein ACFSTH_00940 [Paenibacillus yanchengensis]|uniref:DUF3955 domain-containing protein n=1 Tax=Paenibacillus yanchengensis TaxID=2035833 RepID=A0ABW4YF29_9BACL
MKRLLELDKLLNVIGILLIIGFIVRLGADYYKSQNLIDAAPFYSFIIGRSVLFLLPSAICFISAIYFVKKRR